MGPVECGHRQGCADEPDAATDEMACNRPDEYQLDQGSDNRQQPFAPIRNAEKREVEGEQQWKKRRMLEIELPITVLRRHRIHGRTELQWQVALLDVVACNDGK